MRRTILRSIVRLIFRWLSRLEVHGQENLPAHGGYLLCSNHLGLFDAPLIFAVLERPDARALVARKHQRSPFYRWLIDAVDGT